MNNSDFQSQTSLNGFTMKLWRGERMSLVAFNVEHPEPDLVGFAIDEVGTAGALHDALGALLFCHPPRLLTNVINGQIRVRDGELQGLDLRALIARHNALALSLR